MAGANRSLLELVTNLPEGIDPLLVVATDGPVADAFRAAGVPCRVVGPTGGGSAIKKEALRGSLARRIWNLRVLPGFAFRLFRVVREERIDLIHANDPLSAIFILPASRLARRPLVTHVRGEIPFGGPLRRLAERAGDRFITVSAAVRGSLGPRARGRASAVYNGIEGLPTSPRTLPWLEGLRARGVAVVCCFASVVPFKGHHHLVAAVRRLNERGWRDRVVFLCVGDLIAQHYLYQAWLRDEVARARIDNLMFTGWQDDPFAFYRCADISVLPSVSEERLTIGGEQVEVRGNEGFPRTHLEAMRFGVPVVGTRIAGVPEQVADGETGLVVEPGDAEALADAIEAMLASPERRREMGARGLERVERLFSTRAYVEGVLRVYESLLPGRVPVTGAAE